MVCVTRPPGDLEHVMIQHMLAEKTFDEKIASITQDLLGTLTDRAESPKDHEAHLLLGYFYLVQSLGDETMTPRALRHLECAHENGSAQATVLLTEIYSNHISFYSDRFTNTERAFIMSSYAAQRCPAHGKYLEAIASRTDDRDKAFEIAQRSQDDGYIGGDFLVARWMTDGFNGSPICYPVGHRLWDKILGAPAESLLALCMQADAMYWKGNVLGFTLKTEADDISEQFRKKASEDWQRGMDFLRRAASFGIPEARELLEIRTAKTEETSGKQAEALPPGWYMPDMRLVDLDAQAEEAYIGNLYLYGFDRSQSGEFFTIRHLPSNDEIGMEKYLPTVRARIHFPDQDAVGNREKTAHAPVDEAAIAEILAPLDRLPGLKGIKKEVGDLLRYATVIHRRRKEGLSARALSAHMVFTGNPGTGKTITARMIGSMLYQVGLLSEGHVIEADAASFFGEYIGWTESKTQLLCEASFGGILFIDEAYNLSDAGSMNGFGNEAIGILMKMMEDHGDKMIVIAAGYKNKMEDFLRSNPGLRSRFSETLSFADYTAEEKAEIFRVLCADHDYIVDDWAGKKVLSYFRALKGVDRDRHGNARGVRNLFDTVLKNQARRLIRNVGDATRDELMLITADDIPGGAAVGGDGHGGTVVVMSDKSKGRS